MTPSSRIWIFTGVIVVAAAAAVGWWWLDRPELPDGIASGNGRIEADELFVAAKYPGRVDAVMVEEGDLVEEGQVLARMDTAELEASLREAKAVAREAAKQRDVASANIAQREAECELAERELARSSLLFERNVAPQSDLDVKQSRFRTAKAACDAANAQIADAEAAIEAAQARVDRIEVQLDETFLRAPAPGRVLYRLAEPGEVLAAGGRVLALIDLSDVYMEIFLPSRLAARVAIGAEARVVVDAAPDMVIPAAVSFVAPEAQFTPRQVETRSERDKLVFRVKVRIPRDIVEPRIEVVKTGVRGVAYVRLEGTPRATWPESLEPRLPPPTPSDPAAAPGAG